jgi:hypothetical protein
MSRRKNRLQRADRYGSIAAGSTVAPGSRPLSDDTGWLDGLRKNDAAPFSF